MTPTDGVSQFQSQQQEKKRDNGENFKSSSGPTLHKRTAGICFEGGYASSKSEGCLFKCWYCLDPSFVVHQYLIQNIKAVIKSLTETKNTKGSTTDDKRSIVQSMVLECLPSPTFEGKKKPSDRSIADSLGLDVCTCRRIVKAVADKRISSESSEDDKETVYSQVLKSKEGQRRIKHSKKGLNGPFVGTHLLWHLQLKMTLFWFLIL